jgi:ribosome-associated toxin RatA of RatAB toxin-antitoxin module
MKNIHTINSKILPYARARIWEAITDLPNYSAWWPSSLKIKTLHLSEGLLGSRIEIRPYGGQAFYCEVSGMDYGAELMMAYTGIYTGTGRWTISEVKARRCVTYEIELKIESPVVRLLSSVLPVASIHSHLMEKVLSGLGRYLEEIDKYGS